MKWNERPDEGVRIWPDMQDAVGLFFALATQWRWIGAGMGGAWRTGLDYQAVEATARNSGLKMTPAIFDDIRTLELEALSVFNRKSR